MGDFAFDAVCETMDTEFERDSNEHFDTRLPHFMFDMGVFDMESLSRDYEQLSMVLDALGNTGLGAVRHPLDWTERLHQESEVRLRKYLVPWEMRLGMATQVMRGKLLTEKQKKWMQTNWRKGADDFEKTFTQHSKRFIAFKGLQITVERIKAAIEMKVLRKQND